MTGSRQTPSWAQHLLGTGPRRWGRWWGKVCVERGRRRSLRNTSPSRGPDVLVSHEAWRRRILPQGFQKVLRLLAGWRSEHVAPEKAVAGEEQGAVSAAPDEAGAPSSRPEARKRLPRPRLCRAPGWPVPGRSVCPSDTENCAAGPSRRRDQPNRRPDQRKRSTDQAAEVRAEHGALCQRGKILCGRNCGPHVL